MCDAYKDDIDVKSGEVISHGPAGPSKGALPMELPTVSMIFFFSVFFSPEAIFLLSQKVHTSTSAPPPQQEIGGVFVFIPLELFTRIERRFFYEWRVWDGLFWKAFFLWG